jgi:4-hydroxy-tetrahydrodipicolinate synthase
MTPFSGLWCATLTPLTRDLAPDLTALDAHCRWLLTQGCDGIALFGTTGEGFAFSVSERRRTVEQLRAAGLPETKLVVGTGATALPDAIELTRHATEIGAAGTLIVPPFYLKGVDEEGLFAFFARLIDSVADQRLRILLYNIPQLTAVAIPAGLARRLADRFPGIVIGVKDSSGDWRSTASYLETCPDLAILVGNEPDLPRALAAGGAGTICGLANIAPRLMRRLLDAPSDAVALVQVERLVAAIDAHPFIPALKACLAVRHSGPGWLPVRPPLQPLPRTAQVDLAAAVDGIGWAPKVTTPTP